MNYNRQEELRQMKRLPMEQLLNIFGINVKSSGLNNMFRATWRNEKVASVSIRQAKDGAWIFVDHGNDDKGSNIDLVMKIRGWSYIQTVQWFRNNFSFFSFPKSKKNYQEKVRINNSIAAAKWKILANQNLIRLLKAFNKERHLPEKILRQSNIRELKVKHINTENSFWIAGHKNINGGWELFNPKPKGFKSCISPKGISCIKGQSDDLIVAESVIDVISARIILKIDANLLSLNSTKLSKRAGLTLKRHGKIYDRIILCLDNDKAGMSGTQILLQEMSNIGKIEVFQYKYANDPNSELISINSIKKEVNKI